MGRAYLMTAMLTGAVVLARYILFSLIVIGIFKGQGSIDPLRELALSPGNRWYEVGNFCIEEHVI